MANDIVTRLRTLSPRSSFSAELPDEDDLLNVEEALLIGLPRDFRHWLLMLSDLELADVELMTASDERVASYLPEVAAEAWSEGLPRHFIPVARYDGGYCAIEAGGEVMFWRGGEQNYWQDLWEWSADILLGHGSHD